MADELTDKQRRAIAALLVERTIEKAAQAAQVSERQLYRWLDNGPFKASLTEASRQRLAETLGRLRVVANEAVETLRDALRDKGTANRIRAAQILLDTAVKVEVDHLNARVAALESAEAARGKQ